MESDFQLWTPRQARKTSSYWKFIEVTHSWKSGLFSSKFLILSTGVPRRLSPSIIAARWRYRLPSNNLIAHYNSQSCVSFHFGGVVLYIAGLVSNPCMLKKYCNSNPICTFPPCYAFQIIFTELAPRLIQSISRNVHNKKRALKRVCNDSAFFSHPVPYFFKQNIFFWFVCCINRYKHRCCYINLDVRYPPVVYTLLEWIE